jgi:hypothetical protein
MIHRPLLTDASIVNRRQTQIEEVRAAWASALRVGCGKDALVLERRLMDLHREGNELRGLRKK